MYSYLQKLSLLLKYMAKIVFEWLALSQDTLQTLGKEYFKRFREARKLLTLSLTFYQKNC